MAGDQLIGIFSPLLVIIVMGVSTVSRGMDLATIAKEDHAPFVYMYINNWLAQNFISKIGLSLSQPGLGRFSTLHIINVTLLVSGIHWVRLSSGTAWRVRIVATVLFIMILLFLPLFEVDEYDMIFMGDRREWASLGKHVGMWSLALFLYLIDILISYFVLVPTLLSYTLYLFAFCVGAYAIVGYLGKLNDELANAAVRPDPPEHWFN